MTASELICRIDFNCAPANMTANTPSDWWNESHRSLHEQPDGEAAVDIFRPVPRRGHLARHAHPVAVRTLRPRDAIPGLPRPPRLCRRLCDDQKARSSTSRSRNGEVMPECAQTGCLGFARKHRRKGERRAPSHRRPPSDTGSPEPRARLVLRCPDHPAPVALRWAGTSSRAFW